MWQLEGLGIGNLARIKEQRGEQSKAIIDFFKVQDMVAARGHQGPGRSPVGRGTGRHRPSEPCARASPPSTEASRASNTPPGFGEVLVLINRPQEVVFALQLFKISFDEYFTTVADYNRAQFELFHALGYPAREITYVRPPGTVVPVDTTRPDYLPPVGNGPPPATR